MRDNKEANQNYNQQIVIFETETGETQIDVRLENDTVWLKQEQMSELFGRERTVITKHIGKIFTEGELDEKSNVQILHIANSDKPVKVYSLDVIISVGYRVKSQRGTQFRMWANSVLKQYLVQGYALNERKLQAEHEKLNDLKRAIALSSRLLHNQALTSQESQSILAVLEKYSHALTILDDYDHQRLQIIGTAGLNIAQPKIDYAEAMMQIYLWRKKEQLGGLFGNEKDNSFKSALETIYQTFDKQELYPSIEEKAANLLYFIVKNHAFSDGNKRIAAAMFVWFLERNQFLYNDMGEKRIADNALVAFTLLIAESKPDEREMIVKVIINLINGNN